LRKSQFALALVLVWIGLGVGYCSPTGLNVVPTADVLSKDTYVVLSPWSGGLRFGPEGEIYSLLQVGAGRSVEVGLDQWVNNGILDSRLNAKWKLMEEESGRPAIAIGVQNVARYSNDQPYMVATKALDRSGRSRLHAGLISMDGASRAMLGLDKSCGPTIALQADYVSGNENSLTAGFALKLAESTALWVARSFPNGSGSKSDYFVRLGFSARL